MTNRTEAATFCLQATECLKNEDLNNALEYYQKALKINDLHYDAIIGTGIVKNQMAKKTTDSGKNNELLQNAITQFEKADSINPVQKEILIMMKEIYSAQGKGEKVRGINERIHETA
jgi:tetratricopeptide (TPR) repeat protein